MQSPSRVVLRPAAPEDARAIAEARVAGWRHAYAGIMPDEVLAGLDPGDQAPMWREWVEYGVDRGEHLIVAEVDGAVIGFAAFGPLRPVDEVPPPADPSVAGELYALYVVPSSHGSGVGRALFHASVAALDALGRTEHHLWVVSGNHAAQAFYRNKDWADDGSRKWTDYGGQLVESMRFRPRR